MMHQRAWKFTLIVLDELAELVWEDQRKEKKKKFFFFLFFSLFLSYALVVEPKFAHIVAKSMKQVRMIQYLKMLLIASAGRSIDSSWFACAQSALQRKKKRRKGRIRWCRWRGWRAQTWWKRSRQSSSWQVRESRKCEFFFSFFFFKRSSSFVLKWNNAKNRHLSYAQGAGLGAEKTKRRKEDHSLQNDDYSLGAAFSEFRNNFVPAKKE